MEKRYSFWDGLAAWLGVTCDDWDADFADDGYADFWGRAPLNEPIWWESAEEPSSAPRNVTVIPLPRRRGQA